MKNETEEESSGYNIWLKETNDNNLQSNSVQSLFLILKN